LNRFFLAALVTTLAIVPQTTLAQTAPTLTLSQAIAEADLRNPEILAALQAVEIDRARLQQVAPAPLALLGGPSVGVDVPGGVGTVQTFNAGVAQQFSPAGSLTAGRRIASAGVAISAAQVQVTRRDVERRVITAYYALASAQAQVSAGDQNVATTQELLRSADLRNRAGAVGRFEVLRANVELRRSQTDLLRAQTARRSAALALNTLIGRDGSATIETAVLTVAPASDEAEQALFARAVAMDPTAAQLQASVDQAGAREMLARSQRAPTFAANAGFQLQRAPINGSTSVGPVAGFSLSVPIVDFGTVRGAVREAQASAAYSRAQLTARSVQIRSDVAQSVADVQSSRAREAFAQTSLQQAEEALKIAQFGYRQGALGVLDVLSARNAVANARADVDQASADLAAAVARLQLLVGAPINQ
jgi:outer membrane protein TolC